MSNKKSPSSKSQPAYWTQDLDRDIAASLCSKCPFFTYIDQEDGSVVRDFCVCERKDEGVDFKSHHQAMKTYHLSAPVFQSEAAWRVHANKCCLCQPELDYDEPEHCGCGCESCVDCCGLNEDYDDYNDDYDYDQPDDEDRPTVFRPQMPPPPDPRIAINKFRECNGLPPI